MAVRTAETITTSSSCFAMRRALAGEMLDVICNIVVESKRVQFLNTAERNLYRWLGTLITEITWFTGFKRSGRSEVIRCGDAEVGRQAADPGFHNFMALHRGRKGNNLREVKLR